MKRLVSIIKANKALSNDLQKSAIKHVSTSANFIATSRKVELTCSCGMHATVWTDSGFYAAVCRDEWMKQHAICSANGYGPTFKSVIN